MYLFNSYDFLDGLIFFLFPLYYKRIIHDIQENRNFTKRNEQFLFFDSGMDDPDKFIIWLSDQVKRAGQHY